MKKGHRAERERKVKNKKAFVILLILAAVIIFAIIFFASEAHEKMAVAAANRTLTIYEINKAVRERYGVYAEILIKTDWSLLHIGTDGIKPNYKKTRMSITPYFTEEEVALFKQEGEGSVRESATLKDILRKIFITIKEFYPEAPDDFNVYVKLKPPDFEEKIGKLDLQEAEMRKFVRKHKKQ